MKNVFMNSYRDMGTILLFEFSFKSGASAEIIDQFSYQQYSQYRSESYFYPSQICKAPDYPPTKMIHD